MKLNHFFTLLFIITAFGLKGQGLVGSLNSHLSKPSCGSYEFMKDVDHTNPGYMDMSNSYLRNLQSVISASTNNRDNRDVLRVPIVFHIVYNDSLANLPDSVIQNQIEVLNANFGRTNADTGNLRTEFKSLVKAADIEFYLADHDPDGNPSNGITRTHTSITHFGGILPYDASQTALIQQWVNDSLMYNMFRISQDSLGGKSAWNLNEYMNVWIGDLRILEPKVNNFEELVFFGLSTPPNNHSSWPDSVVQTLPSYTDGTLMHFVNVGANNPNQFQGPYAVYNGLVNTGKMLVHETGHYLGLRHIWGDGDCSFDDYIHDTPRATAASQFNSCNTAINSCLDTINGVDLPNMVENYMDYSSATCQVAFTNGQVDIMRAVLNDQRENLVLGNIELSKSGDLIRVYPNPTSGLVNLELVNNYDVIEVRVINLQGEVISTSKFSRSQSVSVDIPGTSGLYFIIVETDGSVSSYKVMKM